MYVSQIVMPLVYRFRVPVVRRRSRRIAGRGLRCGGRGLGRRRRCRRGGRMRGGVLPFLAPIIAAAVGAVPAIASVALQAKAMNK